MNKSQLFKIKGMQRDLSVSAANSEHSYENHNIRIMSTNENTLLSIINERGNVQIDLGMDIEGLPIGQAVLEEDYVLFTIESESLPSKDGSSDVYIKDRIYRIWIDNGNKFNAELLYAGDLGFDSLYPIETLVFHENDSIKKVYWVDGKNSARVINIAADADERAKWNNSSFDFVRQVNLIDSITVRRNTKSSGMFPSGTIQYAYTYYNRYEQETNIVGVSPLYYIAFTDRGGSPEDKVSCTFSIEISKPDTNFEYIRLYSILRTSIDGTPTVKRVVDLSTEGSKTLHMTTATYYENQDISNVKVFSNGVWVMLSDVPPSVSNDSFHYKIWNFRDSGDLSVYTQISVNDDVFIDIEPTQERTLIFWYYEDTSYYEIFYSNSDPIIKYDNNICISYSDNGSSGDVIDPTELLYIGGESLIPYTISQKDNTLFLGNIKIDRKLIDEKTRNFFRDQKIRYSISKSKYIDLPDPKGFYPYSNTLSKSSSDLRTFKYLETYRFGVQFQYKTGKWSEPVWIGDFKNTLHPEGPYTHQGTVYFPTAKLTITDEDIIKGLVDSGYVRIRPVIVYPELQDRECLCQGILCPTVFNYGDRYGNSPFAQSSWFSRPDAPFDVTRSSEEPDLTDRDTGGFETLNSRTGIMSENTIEYEDQQGRKIYLKLGEKGTKGEYRHNAPLVANYDKRAEIQSITYPTEPKISVYEDASSWITYHSENFGVDKSIITFHSPDIEFDDNIQNYDLSGLQLRIVGIVPLTSFVGDMDIQTSTPPNNYYDTSIPAPGFHKESVQTSNISRFGFRTLMSKPMWIDEAVGWKESPQISPMAFVVYPWHRNGSLNNAKYNDNGYRSAMLDKKKISNLKYSYNSYYFDTENIWYSFKTNDSVNTGISGAVLFNSGEVTMVKIPSPINSDLPDLNYYGNVDKILNIPIVDGGNPGYFITIAPKSTTVSSESIYSRNYSSLEDSSYLNLEYKEGVDPVSIKYKSSPHIVMALNYTAEGYQRCLPVLKDGNVDSSTGTVTEKWDINARAETLSKSEKYFWEIDKKTLGVTHDYLDISFYGDNGSYNGYGPEYGYFYIGELYNPNITNKFGGQTEEALESNLWLPCGNPVSLVYDNGNVCVSVSLEWTEGDTYYQRYDHLKTYPFTLEDQNSVVEIVSFMCETRINIDGRYDRNRGQVSNLTMTPTNFNLLNPVYSQDNNYFNYRYMGLDRFNINDFQNSITWTKTKTPGEDVDTWTNVTFSSVLDMDGDKGPVRTIKKMGNNLIVFQDRGISQILYNESSQISTSQGIPIEIANSGKVNGKRYISEKVGCTNKWSICETANGIYFIDDINKGIYLLNEGLTNLSDSLGFHSWINSKLTHINIWNPKNFGGFVSYFDKVNGDVFFISKSDCLAFSEPLGQFSSFYNYEASPYFCNLEDKGFFIRTSNENIIPNKYRLWLHNSGDYNMFFGTYKPFSVTVISNADMTADKIFNTVEFRSDSWDSSGNILNTTFDNLYVWNEYQYGKASLRNLPDIPSNLKRKFRIWRANIPRDSSNNRDRIRNPWIYLKLAMESPNTNKTILHDITVNYFE